MNSKLRLVAVEPAAGKQQVRITWNNGTTHTVSLATHIVNFSCLTPLAGVALFKQVQVDKWGFDLAWPGDIELAASTLHRLALEQA